MSASDEPRDGAAPPASPPAPTREGLEPLMTAREFLAVLGMKGRGVCELMRRDPECPRPVRPLQPTGRPRWVPEEVREYRAKLLARDRIVAAPMARPGKKPGGAGG